MNHNAIATLAIHYGAMNQCVKAIEEMAELTEALAHFINNDGRQSRGAILTEIADVYIMLSQLEHIVGISQTELDEEIEYKLTRALEALTEERT